VESSDGVTKWDRLIMAIVFVLLLILVQMLLNPDWVRPVVVNMSNRMMP